MAGFFGLFDYSKPGKGVDKEGPQKKRFFVFFEIYFRKFWKLITLNLLYLVFCIPIVTIGPATAAMTAILKNYTMERPVFLFSDFFQAFKENWKKGFVVGLIDAVAIVCLYFAVQFYLVRTVSSLVFYIPLAIVLSAGMMLLLASAYMFIMIPVLKMNFKPMFKNAFFLSILGIKTNLITTGIVVLLTIGLLQLSIFIAALIMIFLFFSTIWFIITFNSFQYVEKYIINPYYESTGEKRPDVMDLDDIDEDEFVFQDIGTQEQQVQQPKKGKSGRVIK